MGRQRERKGTSKTNVCPAQLLLPTRPKPQDLDLLPQLCSITNGDTRLDQARGSIRSRQTLQKL